MEDIDNFYAGTEAYSAQPNSRVVISKVLYRLIPFVILLFFTNNLDRMNVAFAALTMNKDLGFSSVVFGMGAGVFFVGYFLFEVPSNLILNRVGARIWIFRIMLTWGIIVMLMPYVQNKVEFYILRFLLGAAEAGFTPGIQLYLIRWVPKQNLGRAFSLFMCAVPLSTVIGAPLCSGLLRLDGTIGLAGWQWLFTVTGLLAVVLSFFVLYYLDDHPKNVTWLKADERKWLVEKLQSEEDLIIRDGGGTSLKSLLNARVLGFSLVYFLFVIGIYGVGFWLPQIMKSFGFANLKAIMVTAIPYAFATVGMILWSFHSDKTNERRWHLVAAQFLAAFGLCAAALSSNHLLEIVMITVSTVGVWAAIPVFWTQPPTFLTGTAVAAGIAMINSIGNLGGFVGPYIVGVVKQFTGNFSMALMVLAASLFLSGLVALIVSRRKMAV